MMFAVIGIDKQAGSGNPRDLHRQAHRDYELSRPELTRLAGPLYTPGGEQCGTLKLVEAESVEEVMAWYRNEPFYRNSIYRNFYVMEWRMAFNMLDCSDGWVETLTAEESGE